MRVTCAPGLVRLEEEGLTRGTNSYTLDEVPECPEMPRSFSLWFAL